MSSETQAGPRRPPRLADTLQIEDSAARAAARKAGLALLAEGRVATLVVAGGQGTRLGHAGPKGDFPIGPVSQRTLFALQAQRIPGIQRRTGKPLPWIVMTSEDTDLATRASFAAADHFGLEVGGMLAALAESGLLEALAARGFCALAYQQVDNPLARTADATVLGFLTGGASEAATQLVRKRSPDERLGTVGLRDGRTHVVEYTELGPAEGDARRPDGEVRLWAGAIGLHATPSRSTSCGAAPPERTPCSRSTLRRRPSATWRSMDPRSRPPRRMATSWSASSSTCCRRRTPSRWSKPCERTNTHP